MTSKQEKKPHGNTGKKHASKGFDGHLNIRCPISDKSKWVKCSQRENKKLTAFVIETLNAYCESVGVK